MKRIVQNKLIGNPLQPDRGVIEFNREEFSALNFAMLDR